MKIQILGLGCPTCKNFFELTKRAVAELGLNSEIEYITDFKKIIGAGIMQPPALVINGKTLIAGFVPNIEKIKKIIKENI